MSSGWPPRYVLTRKVQRGSVTHIKDVLMRSLFAFMILISISWAQGSALEAPMPHAAVLATQGTNLSGRWQVKFNLSGVGEKNLLFQAHIKGSGSFLLLDTGPNGESVTDVLSAAWSQPTNDRVNFSGEVELPIGTCCREIGTLILKGKFTSSNSISGKAIFVASTVDEENYTGFRSMLGSFTATRIPAKD
jgi:hypothetical protein